MMTALENYEVKEIGPFKVSEKMFRFYHEHYFSILAKEPWVWVLVGLSKHYDVYRQGKLEHDTQLSERDYKMLEGESLNFVNYFLMCSTMFSSWFSFQNTVRSLVDQKINQFRPYAVGNLRIDEDVDVLGLDIFEYLQTKRHFVDLESEKGWVYEKTDDPRFSSKEFKHFLRYFVDQSGKWVYFTTSPGLMNATFFMTFLKEFSFLISYYDRLGAEITLSTGKIKNRSAIHEASCKDEAYCYRRYNETIPAGKPVDPWPSVDDVQGYLYELFQLQQLWEGDWSLLRPENYDFFEFIGGLDSLQQLFFEIFFGGFLRILVQGQVRDVPELQVRKTPMGEFQKSAFPGSQPHFKFLWDLNLTHKAVEYYKKPLDRFHIYTDYSTDMLLYNPQWITESLRQDLLHWLTIVRSEIGNYDEMLPIFGFALTDEGKEEEREFFRILSDPKKGKEHAQKFTDYGAATPYGIAVAMYRLMQGFEYVTAMLDLFKAQQK